MFFTTGYTGFHRVTLVLKKQFPQRPLLIYSKVRNIPLASSLLEGKVFLENSCKVQAVSVRGIVLLVVFKI